MNCEQAHDKLIDLVYGELPPAEAEAVRTHAEACAACGAELAALTVGRELMTAGRAAEPTEAPKTRLGKNPSRGARVLSHSRIVRWGAMAAAAAALVLVLLAAWRFGGDPEKRVIAEPLGDVRIVRRDVSVTILSSPPNWNGYFPGPGHPDANKPLDLNTMGQWRPGYQWGFPGMALVRDERVARNLRLSSNEVRFGGVPSWILPDTVRLVSQNRPGALSILEQNYQYDLATAGAILHKYIDRPIRLQMDGGESLEGILLSHDAATLVIQPSGQGPQSVARAAVRAIGFDKLPEGLLTEPTLAWTLDNRARIDHDLEVAYLTYGLTWRADYRVTLQGAERHAKDDQGRPLIIDTADVAGFATLTNNSGVTFEDAQLKLMAGDLNLIPPPWLSGRWTEGEDLQEYAQGGKLEGFAQKAFFEYHLYTLGRRTTLRHAETKQIELLTARGVQLQRKYVFGTNARGWVQVVHELWNRKDNRMGIPLPKGNVRLYAPDPAGAETFIKAVGIDHTPRDEKLELTWGYAFDLVGQITRTEHGYAPQGGWRTTHSYSLRNHKDYDVLITVHIRVPLTATDATCKRPWHVIQAGLVHVPVVVEAGKEVTFDFTYDYDNQNGGGLKSPHDQPQPAQNNN